MAEPKRIEPAEVIALAGGALGIIGQAVFLYSASKDGLSMQDASDALKLIGVALFVFGGVVGMRDVSKRLAGAQTAALEDRLRGLERSLCQRFEALSAAHRLSATASTMAEVIRWAGEHPGAVHIAATSATVDHLVNGYTPPIAESLRRYTVGQPLSLELQDHSPIHDLLWRLGDRLPDGAAWFGITRLESRNAWDSPDDSFQRFLRRMRARARSNRLEVLRLYHFRDRAGLDSMLVNMADELEANIVVRFAVGGDPPEDLSLLLAPTSQPPDASERRSTSNATPSASPIDEALHAGRSPVCALEYHTHGGTLLTRVAIHPGDSDRFRQLAEHFSDRWEGARDLRTWLEDPVNAQRLSAAREATVPSGSSA
jgi:hypothetical protein